MWFGSRIPGFSPPPNYLVSLNLVWLTSHLTCCCCCCWHCWDGNQTMASMDSYQWLPHILYYVQRFLRVKIVKMDVLKAELERKKRLLQNNSDIMVFIICNILEWWKTAVNFDKVSYDFVSHKIVWYWIVLHWKISHFFWQFSIYWEMRKKPW